LTKSPDGDRKISQPATTAKKPRDNSPKMMSGQLFSLFRVIELLTLIPIWGILAYFVNAVQPNTPDDTTLYVFIVPILATVWAFFTLLAYRRTGFIALSISIVDLIFFGLFIGGAVLLAPRARWTNCVRSTVSWEGWQVVANRNCMMWKAAWGLGIAGILLFFITSMLAAHMWHHSGAVIVYEERRHVHRSSRKHRRRH
jgi:hypothetical protein